MGKISMDIYLSHLRSRYRRATKAEKSQLVKDFCSTYGYHRKSAIRLLNKPPIPDKRPSKGGKPPIYDKSRLLEPLKRIWLSTDQMCGKRLKKALPLWLPYYQKHYKTLSDEDYQLLLSMSAATIDRMLKPLKSRHCKGLSGTKPGNLLKNKIPVNTNQWDTTQVGFVEADTVAHCGETLMGNFVWTITLTDIASGWTENRATWNKGAVGVVEQIGSIEQALPFPLLGFDCDNGSEFLNYHLIRYFTDRKAEQKVAFTRSRPYHKDDNAHVEQKNWTHVRQVFGYHRFDNPKLVALMNDLYSNELSDLTNFFYPCVKLKDKKRVKAKIIKTYDTPKTPYQRLLDADCLSVEQKKNLSARIKNLDPFDLQKRIQNKLKKIFKYVNLSSRQKRRAI